MRINYLLYKFVLYNKKDTFYKTTMPDNFNPKKTPALSIPMTEENMTIAPIPE